jgi:hypothetical protein
MANKTSQHILGAAANLLGFCLVVLTSLHIAERTENTLIDEFTSIVAVLLTFSCILSFISLKVVHERREQVFETLADILFFLALTGIIGIISFIAVTFWNK